MTSGQDTDLVRFRGLVPIRGVMLVGHGTRDDEGARQFIQLGERLASRLSPMPVETCCLEFQKPTIGDAWSRLIERGATHIHVAPLLLFAAGHARQDIPEAVSECGLLTPQISFDQARPISRHRAIVELVHRRASETLRRSDQPHERTAVVMVGRGSRDPCAQADMRVLSEVVQRRLHVAKVHTAFYAMAEPRLADVIQCLALSGDYDRIIIHPHLLFSGRIFESILTQTAEAASRYPSIRFDTAEYLGPDDLVCEAIAARIEQGDWFNVHKCRV